MDRDLRLTALAAVICTVVVVAVPVTPVRAVFVVPLCLVLPGYGLVAAAFARTRPAWLVQLMLIPALSLVTLGLSALLLDLMPGQLNEASWAILLVTVVCGECIVAQRGRASAALQAEPIPDGRARDGRPSAAKSVRNASSSNRSKPSKASARPTPVARTTAGPTAPVQGALTAAGWRLRITPLQWLMLILAALLAAGALTLSRLPLPAAKAIGYTQLWMLSTGTPAAPSVRIGVTSDEQHPTSYRMALSTGSNTPIVLASDLRLRPGRSTTLSVPLFNVPGPESLVTLRLYRINHSGTYREVTALIRSSLPAAAGSKATKTAAARLPTKTASVSTRARTTKPTHVNSGPRTARKR